MNVRRVKSAIVYSLLWAMAWAVSGVFLPFLQVAFSRTDESLGGLVRFIPIMAANWAVLGFIGGLLVACLVMFAERGRTVDQISVRRMGAWGAVPGLLLPIFNILQMSLAGQPTAPFLFANLETAVMLGCVGAGLAVTQLKIARALPPGADAAPLLGRNCTLVDLTKLGASLSFRSHFSGGATVDILSIFREFKTQEQCITYLEQKRWGGAPAGCIKCGSVRVGRHASADRAMQRWQCQDCHASFSVTVGTIFHGTHIPLQSWFLVLGLMLNAKKSASACQIARDLGMRRPTVWSMMHRVRVAMAKDQDQGRLLHGIVEADETYVGGKPRKANRKEDRNTRGPGSGRGTKKAVVLGAVERGGRVVARHATGTSGKILDQFLSSAIDREGTLLVTDEWQAYGVYGRKGNWATINHQRSYAEGLVHTNTIEGFWALVKRAWYGSHHHYSVKHLGLYLAESVFKYNHRKNPNGFETLVSAMVGA